MSQPAITALPHVTQIGVDIGWKVAEGIGVRGDMLTLFFRPATGRKMIYGVEAVASCAREYDPTHEPFHDEPSPADDCRCGFNAWQDLSTALKYASRHRPGFPSGKAMRKARSRVHRGLPAPPADTRAIMRVELSGEVIEGTLDTGDGWNMWGYRAQYQRVTDIFIFPRCVKCSLDTVQLQALTSLHENYTRVEYVCDRHLRESHVPLSIEQIAAHNKVKIHMSHPSE